METIEEQTAELIAPCLQSPYWFTRAVAVKAPIEIGGLRARALLTTVLNDEIGYIRGLAAEALNKTL